MATNTTEEVLGSVESEVDVDGVTVEVRERGAVLKLSALVGDRQTWLQRDELAALVEGLEEIDIDR